MSLFWFIVLVSPVVLGPAAVNCGSENSSVLLKKIYDEAREFGARPGEDFIKAEVFIGKEDDDDTNKDIHVVVLIQHTDGIDRMTVQVTYLERSKVDPRIKNARETKSFACRADGGGPSLLSSDYRDREIGPLAQEILKAIRNKKKLMKSR